MIASQCLGRWLKVHPHDNLVHKVLRYDRETLVCYCGQAIPVLQAVLPTRGVLCCQTCAGLSRQREASKRREHG
jgi:hypothetical protein